MANKEKTYINKCAIREHVFDSGSRVLNCAFNVDELKSHADDNGWVNITIAERQTPSDKGYTHYVYLDEYKPKEKEAKEVEDLPF
jgi:predicted RNase H-like nuclease|tara:strand:- start:3350 stop:3604 length:255 start_codon:yes stop_codon:yes gene_type:complete